MSTTAERPDPKQIITDWRGDAAVLRRNGQETLADRYESMAREIDEATVEFTTWLDEVDAAARSGWSADTVRRWARKFANTEYARYTKGKGYELRMCIVPRRVHDAIAAAEAEQDAA